LQGGLVPSWQTTVVVEFGGTTTVVFAGGGGLLLLMQPDKSPAAIISAVKVFIAYSKMSVDCAHCRAPPGGPAGLKVLCRHEQMPSSPVIWGPTGAKYRFGMGIYRGASMRFLRNFG